ncbi:MAG: hypothetical protein C4589_03985 [Peptococcaceae bacterium]|nr:MAG: hypothetical protein C4589_03985 [Peptococcaceae bacterium]
MIERKLYIFVEGAVDRQVLVSLGFNHTDVTICGSKNKMIEEIRVTAGPDLHNQLYNQLGIVIFRDRDGNETEEDIKQSFFNGFKKLLTENVSLPPFAVFDAEKYPNVYWFQHEERNEERDENFKLIVVLHIARPQPLSYWERPFTNSATEDYILAAGLTGQVLERFAGECRLSPEALQNKVLREIPGVLRSNGIDVQQKDLLAAYMTACRFLVIKRSDDEKSFTRILLDRFKKYAADHLEEVFGSMLAAMKLATDDNVEGPHR